MANFFKCLPSHTGAPSFFCPQEEEEEKSILGARIMSGVCLGKKRGGNHHPAEAAAIVFRNEYEERSHTLGLGSEEGEREFFVFPERDGEEEEVRER